jgi:hypothetical protein
MRNVDVQWGVPGGGVCAWKFMAGGGGGGGIGAGRVVLEGAFVCGCCRQCVGVD